MPFPGRTEDTLKMKTTSMKNDELPFKRRQTLGSRLKDQTLKETLEKDSKMRHERRRETGTDTKLFAVFFGILAKFFCRRLGKTKTNAV